MNAPDREESAYLNDDEERIYFRADTKITNAAKFSLVKEDHTMGNLLRMQLLRDKDVRFAGYKMPHPLENLLEIKIQTNGQVQPLDAMIRSIEDLQREFKTLEDRFKDAIDQIRKDDTYHDDLDLMR